MKTYKERTESILQKTKIKKQRRKRAMTAISTLCVVGLIVGLFPLTGLGGGMKDMVGGNMAGMAPENGIVNDNSESSAESWLPSENFSSKQVGAWKNDRYYTTVLDTLTAWDVEYENVLDGKLPGFDESDWGTAEGDENASSGTNEYVETTDIQVDGVIQSDLIKRTKDYIFYVTEKSENVAQLGVYSIAGKDSAQVAAYNVKLFDGEEFKKSDTNGVELYLSADGKTATVIASCEETEDGDPYVVLISIDVSDPLHMREKDRTYMAGAYRDSCMIDGALTIVTAFRVKRGLDYDEPLEYLPHRGDIGQMQPLSANNVFASESVLSRIYTVVYQYEQTTLRNTQALAVLTPVEECYFSQSSVYFTYGYTQNTVRPEDEPNVYVRNCAMTDIYRIDHTEGLGFCSVFTVEGEVNDRFCMDEREGVLRVVTSVNRSAVGVTGDGEPAVTHTQKLTASLYCFLLSYEKKIVEVKDFAPEGEQVYATRFDGDTVYVCTAAVSMGIAEDPVFAFDLSDYQNITWKDTGTIPGYSISLIDFGEYLLGVGYGERAFDGKVEVFRQTENAVVSVCGYGLGEGTLPSEYKALFIDREQGVLGLAFGREYLLLRFDGKEISKIFSCEYGCDIDAARAVLIDGSFYLFGQALGYVTFTAQAIGQ